MVLDGREPHQLPERRGRILPRGVLQGGGEGVALAYIVNQLAGGLVLLADFLQQFVNLTDADAIDIPAAKHGKDVLLHPLAHVYCAFSGQIGTVRRIFLKQLN